MPSVNKPRLRDRLRALLAGGLVALIAASGLTVVSAEAALADGPGQGFSCVEPTFFTVTGDGTNSRLFVGRFLANGTSQWTQLGAADAANYNALAFSEQDNYLYGTGPTGIVYKIDSAGTATSLGKLLPNAASTLWDSGTIDEVTDTYYVANQNAGGTTLYKVSNISAGPRVVTTTTISNVRFADFSLKDGFLWAKQYGGSNIYRINPTTGATNTFASTATGTGNFASSFTLGNGNLAFVNDNTMYQVQVNNPTATTPTFTLVNSVTAPANSRADGANCDALPTDLSVTKTASIQSTNPAQPITWTVTVTNNGPGHSSGFVVKDTVPANVTNVSFSAGVSGCATAAGVITCQYGYLAAGGSVSFTVTGTAPTAANTSDAGTDVVNSASVLANELDLVAANNSASVTTRVSKRTIALANDTTTTAYATAKAITPLTNDTITNGAVTAVGSPSNGTAVVTNASTVTYTPNSGFSGADSFTYTATDEDGQIRTATITVTVTPLAVNDAIGTSTNTPVSVPVLTNDGGSGLTVQSVAGATNGTVAMNGSTPTFTPTTNFSGVGTFTYTARDSSNQTTTATVTVTIAPLAVDDTASTVVNQNVTIPVTANDRGTSITLQSATAGTGGSVAVSGSSVVFTPTTGFSGTATFSYTIRDSGNRTGTATVTVAVSPVAVADSATTPANTAVAVPVVGNDLGTGLVVSGVSGASNGTVTVPTSGANAGVPVFTPTTGFSGTGGFDYTITDQAGRTATARATVTVTPVAVADSATTPVDASVVIDVAANDLGANRSVQSVTSGAHGTVTLITSGADAGKVRFTPEAGWSGTGAAAGTFTYVLSGTGGTSTGTATVAITPIAVADTASTPAGVAIPVSVLTGSGADKGTGLAVTAVGSAVNGTVAMNGSTPIFTPAAGFSGVGSFGYTVTDQSGQTSTTTVTVTVTPLAIADSATVASGQSVTVPVLAGAAGTGAGKDIGTGLSVTGVSNASGGTVVLTGGLPVFTATSGFSGTAGFDYAIKDGNNSVSSAHVTVTVTPVAVDDSVATGVNTPVDVNVLANDLGTTKSVVSVANGANGTVALAGGTPRFTPTSGFSGNGTFTYVMRDAAGATSSATVTVRINPGAADDAATTPAETPVAVDVVVNDSGTGLTLTSVSGATRGTVALGTGVDAGKAVFTPAAGYSGSGAAAGGFDYVTTDSAGRTATAHAVVTITPVAITESATTSADNAVVVTVLPNDKGTSLTLTSADQAVGGTVAVGTGANAGKVVFTPTANTSGPASFRYTATDASGQTTSVVVTVTVTPRAVADSGASTFANVALTVTNALANDRGTGLTVTGVSLPQNGTVVLSGGSPVFTPTPGYSGPAQFTYELTDASGAKSSAVYALSVKPIALADTASTSVGTAVALSVTGNDLGSGLTLTSVSGATGGTVALGSGADAGKAVFTPTAGLSGTTGFGFDYVATDSAGVTATAHATVTVTPRAVDDSATTSANTAVTVDVRGNDVGSSLTVTGATNAVNGTVSFTGTGVTFTPTAGLSGSGAFDYTVTDASGQTATAHAVVRIDPVANADSATTPVGTAVTLPVLANDLGTGLAVTAAGSATHGTVAFTSTGVTFTPTAGYSGTGTFSYTITDAAGRTATSTGSVAIGPVAVDDTATTPVGTPVVIDVRANDKGTGLSVSAISNAQHGTATVITTAGADNGKVLFTPAAGYSGPASFDYTVTDGVRSSSASVAIAVTPVAVADSATTSAGTAVDVAVRANDAGTTLTVGSTFTNVVGGTVALISIAGTGTPRFTPAAGFSGSGANAAGFDYTVTDASGQTATARATVTVTPVAVDDSASTPNATAVAVAVVPNDRGTGLALSAIGAVTGGSAVIGSGADAGKVVFTPSALFSGVATVAYTATDASGQTTTATLRVSVTPKAVDDVATTPANQAVTVAVRANDSGSGLVVTNATNAANGTITFTSTGVTFTPTSGFSGDGSFDYTVTDSNLNTSTAHVVVQVTPVAVDDSATTVAGTAVTTDVRTNDLGSSLTVTGATNAANGSVAFTGSGVTFTPAAGFSGAGGYDYTVRDAAGRTSTAHVAVTVRPLAVDDTAATTVGTAVDIDALANDLGVGRTITAIGAVTHGSAVVSGTGAAARIRFTPTANYSGAATIEYTITDANGQSSSAVVTVAVAPRAVADSATTTAGTAATIDVRANDAGTFLVVQPLIANVVGGTATTDGSTVVFTPAAGFSGTGVAAAGFDYTVRDAAGQTAAAHVTVTVTPVAVTESVTTPTTSPRTISVLANDLGSGLVVSAAGSATHGSVAFTASSVTFTPTAGYSGSASFAYTVRDTSGQTATIVSNVVITPVAVADEASTPADTAVAVDVRTNDLGTALTVTGASNAVGGTVSFTGTGVTFTPTAGTSGDGSFDYEVTDSSGQTTTGHAVVHVAPVAVADAVSTSVGTAVTTDVRANDRGTGLTVVAATATAHGTVSVTGTGVTFTPDAGFSGSGAEAGGYDYTVRDAAGRTATAHVTVTITPRAVADTATTAANTAVDIAALGNDLGSALVVTAIGTVSHGSAVIAGTGTATVVRFTPASDYSGPATVAYTATDASGQTTTSSVVVTVTPVAVADSASTSAGTAVDVAVRANDAGTTLTVGSTFANVVGGTVALVGGTPRFTPAAGFSGSGADAGGFDYTVTDASGQAATARATVTVTPVATADSASTPSATAVAVAVRANDLGSSLVVGSAFANVVGGTASLITTGSDAGAVLFTPNALFSGQGGFDYTVTDASGQTATARATVTVTPKAVDDLATTPANTAVTVAVRANDAGTGLVVTNATNAVNGGVTFTSTGVTFTPTSGFSGDGSFDYTVTDSNLNTSTAHVVVQVTPVAVDDSVTIFSGQTISGDPRYNDLGTGLVITGVSSTTAGTVTYTPTDGTFTAATTFSGTTGLDYTITDAAGRSSTAHVTIVVRPVAIADTASTPAGTAVDVAAAANDYGSGLAVTAIGAVTHGTASIVGSGAAAVVRFVPAAGFSGTATVAYTATDGSGRTASSTIAIAVAPTAAADSASTVAGQPVTIDVRDNDRGTGLTVGSTFANVAGGTVALAGGSPRFTPAPGFSGTGGFDYTVTDASGRSATAHVTVTVAPLAVDDAAATAALTPVSVAVLGNDRGAGLAVTAVSGATNGTATFTATGVTFTPAAGFSGTAGVDYTITGDGGTSTAHVTIAVSPVATADTATTPADTAVAVAVLGNDTGSSLTVTDAKSAVNGSVTFTATGVTFTPATGFSGTGSFVYEVTDASGRTATATATVTVTPVALDDTATTDADTAVTVAVRGNDRGSALTVTAVANAVNGSATFTATGVTFTPAANVSGTAGVDYTVTDAEGRTATAHLTVTVRPVATADTASGSVNTPVDIDVLANDRGLGLVVTGVSGATHGTATFTSMGITFTPAAGFSGTAGVDYAISGLGGTSTAHVTIEVAPRAVADTATTPVATPVAVPVLANDLGTGLVVTGVSGASHGTATFTATGVTFTPATGFSGLAGVDYSMRDANGVVTGAHVTVTVTPVAVADAATTTAEHAVLVAVLGNDRGTDLTVTGAGSATHGSVAVTGTGVTFTPADGFSGTAAFAYELTDGHGSVTTGTATVVVTPTAAADTATTPSTVAVSIPVRANDRGTGLVVTVGSSTHATVATDGATVSYTPNQGFSGVDTVAYTVTDAEGRSVSSTIAVTVTPRAVADTATTVSGFSTTVPVLANDSATGAVVGPVTAPAHGTATTNGTTVVYTAAADFSGTDSVTYTLTDAAGRSTTATVTFTVAPFAAADSAETGSAAPVTVDVRANDNGSGLAVTAVGTAAHGSVAFTATGVTYTPATGWSGVDSFDYTVTDSHGATATATVTVTTRPGAAADTAATTAGTPVTVPVRANDAGTGLVVATVANGAHGTTTTDGSTVVYTPAAGFSGVDTFDYTVTDGTTTSTATVTVTVSPRAVADSATVASGSSVLVAVAGNDLGTDLTLRGVGTSSHGTVAIEDGSLRFAAAAGFSGTTTIGYTVRDADGRDASGVLTVVVTPVAVADIATVVAGSPVAVAVLANDRGAGFTVTSTGPAGHGAVTTDGTTVVYTPAAGFSGTDTFTYATRDAENRAATASVTVTVTPLAVADAGTVRAGATVDLDVLGNDRGTGLHLVGTPTGAHGTVAYVAGALRFVADADYSGPVTLSYEVEDAEGRRASATVAVSVTPVAVADPTTVAAGSAATIAVLGNDRGSALTVTVGAASHGTVTTDGTVVVFTPAAGFSGDASFSYTITDAAGSTSTVTVPVTVRPTAVADTRTLNAGQPLAFDPRTNDLGTTLRVTAASAAVNGTVSFTATGVTFTPTAGFSGDASFGYEITDAAGRTATATVTLVVAPVAVADAASTPVATPVTLTVRANDLGTQLAVTAAAAAAGTTLHGTVAIAADARTLEYTPAAGFSGVDTIRYTVTDSSGRTASASVVVTVTPIARPDSIDMIAGSGATSTVAVTANDLGTGLVVQSASAPAHGAVAIGTGASAGSLVYTPTAGYSGLDSVTYTVTDGVSTSTATVSIVVRPRAVDDTAVTRAGVAVSVSVRANDLGTGLVTTAVADGAHGTVAIVSGRPVYTPATGFSGDDQFGYTITDTAGSTSTGTVRVIVRPAPLADSVTVAAGSTATVPVLANDAGSSLHVTGVSTTTRGATSIVDDQLVFTPIAGFSGTVQVDYTVTDAANRSETASVTFTVVPTAREDAATTGVGVAATLDVLANDLGTGVAITSAADGTHGTVAIGTGSNAGRLIYTPEPGYSGIDAFTYEIVDASGQRATGQVRVLVTPEALDGAATTVVGQPVTILPLRDSVGTDLAVTEAGAPQHGTAEVVSGTEILYTPARGFSGTDTFPYTIRDSSGSLVTATITVVVSPLTAPDRASTVSGVATTVPVLANDSGSQLTVTQVSAPRGGVASIGLNGTVVYTPRAGFSGTETITYTATDDSGLTTTGVLTVAVAPVAVADTTSTSGGRTVTLSPTVNDRGTELRVGSVTQPAHGTAVVNADGTVSYTPAAGFSGVDSISYTVVDAEGQVATATITVTVTAGPAGTTATRLVVTGADPVAALWLALALLLFGMVAVLVTRRRRSA